MTDKSVLGDITVTIQARADNDPDFPWVVMDDKGRILYCARDRAEADRFASDPVAVKRHIDRLDAERRPMIESNGIAIEYHPENGSAPWIVFCDGLVFSYPDVSAAGAKLIDPLFLELVRRRRGRQNDR